MIIKKIFFFITVAILLSLRVTGDIYVKENVHYDEKYSLGVMGPATDFVNEWWFGDRCVSVIIGNFRVTLDKKKRRVIVVNVTKQTYVEMSLPLDPMMVVDEEGKRALKFYSITGTLEKKPGKKQVGGKNCDMYLLNEKICSAEDILTYHNKCFYDLERKADVTVEVPFDSRLRLELSLTIRAFFNPEERYVKQLREMKGYVYAFRGTIYLRSGNLTNSAETVEISEKKAPPGIHDSPAGMKKNKTLSFGEIYLLMRFMYTRGI